MKHTWRDILIAPAVCLILAGAAFPAYAVTRWASPRDTFLSAAVFLAVFLPLHGILSVVYLRVLHRLFPSRPGRYAMDHSQFVLWKHRTVVRMLGTVFLRRLFPGFMQAAYHRLAGAAVGRRAVVAENVAILDPACTTIGEGAIVGHGAFVSAHLMADGRFLFGPVRIGRGATVGANASIMPGVEIGEGAVVALGAVVTADTRIPPNELWGGVPARPLKRAAPLHVIVGTGAAREGAL